MKTLSAVVILALGAFPSLAQDKPAAPGSPMCTMHQPQKPAVAEHQHQGVVQRGDEVMGFSHQKTTHHFRVYADGGAIEAEANDAKDTASRDEIRAHFSHIAKLFAEGDFSAPMLIHAQNPPGAQEMKKLRDSIRYEVENTERGGRIRITTKEPKALSAVHEFLRFQIAEHQTGDSLDVTKVP
jgi:hypothetical protein